CRARAGAVGGGPPPAVESCPMDRGCGAAALGGRSGLHGVRWAVPIARQELSARVSVLSFPYLGRVPVRATRGRERGRGVVGDRDLGDAARVRSVRARDAQRVAPPAAGVHGRHVGDDARARRPRGRAHLRARGARRREASSLRERGSRRVSAGWRLPGHPVERGGSLAVRQQGAAPREGESALTTVARTPGSLTVGPLRPVILRLALPAVAMMACHFSFNLIDSIWVGRLIGAAALAAVSTAGFYVWVLLSLGE